MHFLRRDGERRVPAQLRGIIGVAVGEMPDAGIAVRPARNGAQMIDQMAKTGSETVEQAPLRLANPARLFRSEEHTSELQSLMRISYAVFCLKKKNKIQKNLIHSTPNLHQQQNN